MAATAGTGTDGATAATGVEVSVGAGAGAGGEKSLRRRKLNMRRVEEGLNDRLVGLGL
jgi:hypothetical protein